MEETLNAIGTPTDTIYFQSSYNTDPVRGAIIGNIFHYCEFNSVAINGQNIKHSVFNNCFMNVSGVIDSCFFNKSSINCWALSEISNSTFQNFQYTDNLDYDAAVNIVEYAHISNCRFINNKYGVKRFEALGALVENSFFCGNNTAVSLGGDFDRQDSIINCVIINNNIGIAYGAFIGGNIISNNGIGVYNNFFRLTNNIITYNSTGILSYTFVDNITSNVICSNKIYDLEYKYPFNDTIGNNCFCTNDSSQIAEKILDGYEDASRGLITFIPFTNCDSTAIIYTDTTACPRYYDIQTGNNVDYLLPNDFLKINVYPNPFSTSATI